MTSCSCNYAQRSERVPVRHKADWKGVPLSLAQRSSQGFLPLLARSGVKGARPGSCPRRTSSVSRSAGDGSRRLHARTVHARSR